jgi:hypothetical protein
MPRQVPPEQGSHQQFGDFFRNDRSRVDLVRKLITIPKSKNGNTRHVPLNSISLAAFQELIARSSCRALVAAFSIAGRHIRFIFANVYTVRVGF